MEKIKDKKKLYRLINQKTDDNIDIIAYVSRNGKGEILDESCVDDFYHDIFILKGIASHVEHGVKVQHHKEIDYTDFWLLNTSRYPVWIKSHSDNIESSLIEGNDMKFIKTKEHVYFSKKDLYFEHNGKIIYPTPLENMEEALD